VRYPFVEYACGRSIARFAEAWSEVAMPVGRAVQFTAPRRVDIVSVDVPEPGPGQLLVRTSHSGISSGTELLAYRGQLDPDMVRDERFGSLGGTFRYPFTYGYSSVGRVMRGTSELAEGRRVFAFHPHQDLFVVRAQDVVTLPDHVDASRATLFPLVETSLQISLDCGPVAHEPVVVLGLGVVGLLTSLLLRAVGAIVIGVEPVVWRRQLAEALAIHTTDPRHASDAVRDVTGGRGAPLLVDAAGTPAALAGALDLLAHEATALVASWYGTQPVALPLGGAFHRRRLTLRSTQVSTIPSQLSARWDVARRRRTALALLDQLPLERLPVMEMPFADAAHAYALLDGGDLEALHVALRYD
jgi:2-desacetyl-2-hydroxyethyl bacteriochlorophyllide A dehydrogenase